MKKQILILIVFVISMMACSESATLRPNVVVNKQTFTMNIDGKDWVADSTSLVVSPFSNNYTMAVGIKYTDKVKKIPVVFLFLLQGLEFQQMEHVLSLHLQ